MDPFIDYQRFIDRAIRSAEPVEKLGIICDLQPEHIHGQIQIARTFVGRELRATVGICSLSHNKELSHRSLGSAKAVTVVAVIISDSDNAKPMITPLTMPLEFPDDAPPAGEVYVRAMVGAWKEIVNHFSDAESARQYMLGFLAHCCLEWPDDNGDDDIETMPLSEDGRQLAELASKAFECRV